VSGLTDREREKAMFKEVYRARYWSNEAIAVPRHFADSWRDPEFRAAMGVSDEYYQQILASQRGATGHILEHPGYREAQQEHEEAMRVVLGLRDTDLIPPTPAFILQNLNEEQLKAFHRSQEAARRIEVLTREFVAGAAQRRDGGFENALTPELRQQFQEVPLMEMVLGEQPRFMPSAFLALHLTDTQWEQMERIKKELEPEFERHLEIHADRQRIIYEKSNEAFQKAARAETDARLRGENTHGVRLAARSSFLMEDPEYQRALDEVYSSARAFARLFTTRVFEILNDEQRSRLQDLIDNPPPHVRLHIQRLRSSAARPERKHWGLHDEGTNVDREIWVPGADAWRPGDPVPVQLEERERSRFPQDE